VFGAALGVQEQFEAAAVGEGDAREVQDEGVQHGGGESLPDEFGEAVDAGEVDFAGHAYDDDSGFGSFHG
jgi:hypothetical protein